MQGLDIFDFSEFSYFLPRPTYGNHDSPNLDTGKIKLLPFGLWLVSDSSDIMSKFSLASFPGLIPVK